MTSPLIINVVGTRRGVGATTLALRLGASTAGLGYRTAVITPDTEFDYVAQAMGERITVDRWSTPSVPARPDATYDGFGASLTVLATSAIGPDDDDVDVIIRDRGAVVYDTWHGTQFDCDDEFTIVMMTDLPIDHERIHAISGATCALRFYSTLIANTTPIDYPDASDGILPSIDLLPDLVIAQAVQDGTLTAPNALHGTDYARAVLAIAKKATESRPVQDHA